ncbi:MULTISPECIES: hypothetical protein [unclassified Synechococcus]|uniref:hypothetical protein n=1 Tax=unclassified Synechococcus TaxID=2626047 RepID=UPI0021A45FAD|nr:MULTISPECIES: hypothetical protein [unclassified Synechococcus]MCT0212366.1 hypothetical protein [Synechococcus sp. CS-1326]MCT0234549.1 hypothetical protein [Synechococcus sp. CS-1327]
MASRDPYLARINRALKDLGNAVAIEMAPSGKRLRLQATLPKPDGSWCQQRVCTPYPYPAGLEQAQELAKELSRDVELHRRGLQPFPLARWQGEGVKAAGHSAQKITDHAALSRTESWWFGARRRSETAATTWLVDYARPLKSLLTKQTCSRMT